MTRHAARHAQKRDSTEPAIREALRRAGAVVIPFDTFDLLVAFRGAWYVIECKSKGGHLNANQRALVAAIGEEATVHVAYNEADALAAIGAVERETEGE